VAGPLAHPSPPPQKRRNYSLGSSPAACCRLLLPPAAACCCRLLLPPAAACCCRLLPPAAAACCCRLLLPPAAAACCCRLLPPAAAACCRLLPPAAAACCRLLLPPAAACCADTLHFFLGLLLNLKNRTRRPATGFAAVDQMCDAISNCCARCCDCFLFNLLRKKSTFYVLMFLCLFWAVFNLVLSSMSVSQVYDRDSKRATKDIRACNPADACGGKSCDGLPGFPDVANPFEFYVSDKSGNQILKMTCSWPVGNNVIRFGCAIFDIFMFFCIAWYGYWVLHECTPFPKNTKTFHVLLFLAADGWWWVVMVTDAILLSKMNDACATISRRFTNNALATVGSVRVFL
jgi:hypothetical protein